MVRGFVVSTVALAAACGLLANVGPASANGSKPGSAVVDERPAIDPRPDPETLRFIFLAVIREKIPRTSGMSDDEVVEMGIDACRDIDRADGSVLKTLIDRLADGEDPEEISALVAASVVVFCPEYEDEVERIAKMGE